MTNTATVKLTQQLKTEGSASKLAGVHPMTDVVNADATASQIADERRMLLYDPQTLPLTIIRL
jgi:hypothetical protein